MQVKHALGKLKLPGNADQVGQAWMRPLAAQSIPIELRHVAKLYELPHLHRDPFDRMLIAQALSEDMAIVSADAAFRQYAVSIVW